ncbi:MAG: carbon starvation protein A [Planctomycetota bacterium]|nr:MAG: carbon starvation protein A [Planctomycetota bacterium]
MNAVFLALFGLLCFVLAYRFYSRYVAEGVFGIDPDRATPAHEKRDGIDYLPTHRHVLLGHHFTSIAGAAPILGPAIAVIWGWVPALLWVVLGTVFLGAVHDFGCLFVSTRNGGTSIADLTGRIVGPRARILFLLLVFFLAWVVIAVFAVVIGILFASYPATVLPVNFEIVVAVGIGLVITKLRARLLGPSLVALLLLWGMVWVGVEFTSDFRLPSLFGDGPQGQVKTWTLLLLAYSFVASVLPVWVLLQPRDYINSHQLFVGLGALYLALFLYHPPVVAPAFNASVAFTPEGGEVSWFPLLFVTIACGAISGFHGLVGSGTTAKQIDNERDTRPIGYGSMLGEGSLALMSVLCCTAGFASAQEWSVHYGSWKAAGGLQPKLAAFVDGGASFLVHGLSFPEDFSKAAIAVVVISFAATTLDTATRIQRFILQEIAGTYAFRPLQNRYLSSALAAFLPLILIFGTTGEGKPFWTELWPIFGASNQMLGGLSLLVLTFYLLRRGRNAWVVAVPCALLAAMTSFAMVLNLQSYLAKGSWLLVALTILLLALSVWVLLEGILRLRRLSGGEAEDPANAIE